MRIVRYFFVAGISASMDIGIFIVAVKVFGLNWFFVALCSFVLATTLNYFLSINYVFMSERRYKKTMEIFMVFMVSGVGLVINQSVLFGLIEGLKIDEILSKFMATGGVFFWNYILRNRYIFGAC